MLEKVQRLEDEKREYELELSQRYKEIERLNKLKEMELQSAKERRYIKEIDDLKLEVAELRAENYTLGERFLERDIKDRTMHLQLEEKKIESQEKDLALQRLKDSMQDTKKNQIRMLNEK